MSDLTNENELYGYRVKDLPRFAVKILIEKKINDDVKHKFVTKFLDKYLSDEKYKKKFEGCYIFFLNYNFVGIFEDDSDVDEYIDNGDKAILYAIGKPTLF